MSGFETSEDDLKNLRHIKALKLLAVLLLFVALSLVSVPTIQNLCNPQKRFPFNFVRSPWL